MSLSEEVSNTIFTYSHELYLLRQFVNDVDAYIHHRSSQYMDEVFYNVPENFRTELLQYIKEFGKFTLDYVNEAKNPSSTNGEKIWVFRPKKSYPIEVEKHLIPFLVAAYKPIRYPELLYNMALTHIVAIFEAFLSDFIVAIFTERPSTLKSENTATYEEILSFSSRKKLIGHLASNRAEKILEGDLYSVAKKLNKALPIDISKFDKFNIIYEAFCRRHVIVHNNGVTDKKYCDSIPNSQNGVRLTADFQYIETIFTAIGQFIEYFDNFLSRKMRYRRNPIINQLLNPPDSISELGGNSS